MTPAQNYALKYSIAPEMAHATGEPDFTRYVAGLFLRYVLRKGGSHKHRKHKGRIGKYLYTK